MFKGKRIWSGVKKSGPSTPKTQKKLSSSPGGLFTIARENSNPFQPLIPLLPLNALEEESNTSSDLISSTAIEEFVMNPARRESNTDSDANSNDNSKARRHKAKSKPKLSPEISEVAVEVIPIPGPNGSPEKDDSLPDVSWTTTTNTSSYTISSKKEISGPCVSRPLEKNDLDLLRDFIIKVDGAQEAKKFTEKSFICTLLTDQKRGVVNILVVDAWYVVALVSILSDKRPWQKHNQARVIEFKILPTHRNQAMIQVIVDIICATASDKRCARIVVHASPEDFKLFANAEWVVETTRLSRIRSSIPEMKVEKSW